MVSHVLAAALLFAACDASVSAQPAAEAPRLFPDHVGIEAADLDRSVAFYTHVLGLR